MIDQFYISLEKPLPPKTLGEIVNEICIKEEPKPIFCEIPDDLFRKFSYQTSTGPSNATLSSLAPGPAIGTTATAT